MILMFSETILTSLDAFTKSLNNAGNMKHTIIESHVDLLAEADIDGISSKQALIEPSSRQVLLVSGPATYEDIQAYEWCMKSSVTRSWICPREDDPFTSRPASCPPDGEVLFPQVRVTKALSIPQNMHGDIRYMLVIQGKSGAAKAKIIRETSPERAAVAMLAEALIGYSTVLTIAYRASDMASYSNTPSFELPLDTFEICDNLDGLGDPALPVAIVC